MRDEEVYMRLGEMAAARESGKAETPPASKSEDAQTQKVSDLNSLRVKVAELCGWKFLKQGVYVRTYPPGTSQDKIDALEGMPKDAFLIPSDRPNARLEACKSNAPNYPSDLNACAEFEKDMPDRRRSYMDALCAEVKAADLGSNHFDYADLEAVACATSEQRCRAFVATMEGKEK